MCRALEAVQTQDRKPPKIVITEIGDLASGPWTCQTLGKSVILSAGFSFCDKCKNDTDSLFHRRTTGSYDLTNVKEFLRCCTNLRF